MYSHYGELCTEFYDLSKPLGYSTGDVEYYLDRLSNVKGKVLEVGCGSGRVLIPLLQAGVQIDGIDNSCAMLEACRKRCEQLKLNPLLIEGEMHSFSLDSRYEAIIIPGGSFQLIEEREKAVAALKQFNKHLVPGGKLILDLFLPTDFNANAISIRTLETPQQEVLVLEDRRIEVNLIEQKTVSLLKYEKWKDGALLQSELQRFAVSWYGLQEFELLLEKAGFHQISQSADYTFGQKLVNANQMITFEATS